MRWPWVLFLLLLSSGCSTKQPGSKPTEDATASKSPASASSTASRNEQTAPAVTLMSAGNRPRDTLRWQFEEGAKQEVRTVASVSMLARIDGRGGPKTTAPEIINRMVLEVEEVTSDGSARIGFVVTEATLGDPGDVDPSALTQLRKGLEPMTGIHGSYRCSTRGFVADIQLEVPPDLPPEVRQFLDNVRESLRQIVSPLPEERVGSGAKWRVDTEFKHAGLRIEQSSFLEILEINGPVVDLRVVAEQSARSQTLAMPGARPEQPAKLISMESAGGGKAQWNLEKLAATHAQMFATVNMNMRVPGQYGQEHEVIMTLDTTVTMTGE